MEVTGPGTAISGRPWSRAWRGVFSAPLRRAASTTTVPRLSAAITRVRTRNPGRAGGRPLAHGRPLRADIAEESVMTRRIVAIDAASKDGDRHPTGPDRAAVRAAVDAEPPPG